MILLDIFGQNPIHGPGTGTFTEHLLEIVLMLVAAFLLGWWLGRLAVGSWKNKHKEANDELQLLKAESLGLEDKKLEIITLNDKIRLLEEKNSRLRNEVNKPMVNANDAVLEAKLKTQEQLIAKLKADLEESNRRQADFAQTIDVAKVVPTAQPEQKTTKTSDDNVETKLKAAAVLEKGKNKIKAKSKEKSKSKKGDDLKKIEGVGPKIEQLLNADGVKTYNDIIAVGAEKIREILLKAGPQYKVHDPSTWGDQAGLAKAEKWDELYEMQAQLKGGKKV